MTRIYILPDGRELRSGAAFELGGIKFPANWLALAGEEDLQRFGVTQRNDPEPEPVPPEEPNLIYAGDIVDLLSAADYGAIQAAIAQNLDLKRWWDTMATRHEPIDIKTPRFQAAWAALGGVLGKERCDTLFVQVKAWVFS